MKSGETVRILAGLAVFLLVGAGHLAGQEVDPFRPDTIFQPSGSPRIVRLPARGAPVVALRLSIPLTDAAREAGAGYILQRLGTSRARALATSVGAHVDGARTPWGIAYTVVGAAADYDYLAYLLRRAAAEPVEGQAVVRRVVRAAQAEVDRREETGRGRLEASLRRRALPSSPSLRGTRRSLDRLSGSSLHALWARSHAPDRMVLVVSGDVSAEALRVSADDFETRTASEPRPPVGAAPETSADRTEVLRSWYGRARTVPDSRDPHAEVAARLLAAHLRSLDGDFEAEVVLWEGADARALAVIAAAYPRNARSMRRAVRGVLEEVTAALTQTEVENVVDDILGRHLFDARGPEGRVRLVGRALAATGDPEAARRYLSALEAVDADSTRRFLRELATRPAVEAEIRP